MHVGIKSTTFCLSYFTAYQGSEASLGEVERGGGKEKKCLLSVC